MKEDMKLEAREGALGNGSFMCGEGCYCYLDGYELHIKGHGEMDLLYYCNSGYLNRSQEWQCRQDHRPWQKVAAYLKKIIIDEGITYIDRMAFRGCVNVVEVVIPPTVETIGAAAFMDCDMLKKVILPEGVKNIDAYAFANCYWMKEFRAPESLFQIGQYAFNGCLSLKILELPWYTNIGGLGVRAGVLKVKEDAMKSLADMV